MILLPPDWTRQKSVNSSKAIVHRAKWVIVDPWTVIENGFVTVVDGCITDVGHGACDMAMGSIVDHGPGVLGPAWVNGHTHLELTALEGRLPFDSGFGSWVADLIRIRDSMPSQVLVDGIQDGIARLLQHGCPTIGEISTLGLSKEPMRRSRLGGVWFKEILGNNYERGAGYQDPFDERLPDVSLAGHAPHTTSPQVLQQLKAATRNTHRPFSIHASESDLELDFITSAKGPWAEFLGSRGIDFSQWALPAASPIDYLDQIHLLDDNTIVVHGLHLDARDLKILQIRHCWVCLCPRSNYNLHRRLPDLPTLLENHVNVCLGTDSLASVASLSIRDEMRYLSQAYPEVAPRLIYAMATIGGARALLKHDAVGSLHPGKAAWLLYLSAKATHAEQLLEIIVQGNEDHS